MTTKSVLKRYFFKLRDPEKPEEEPTTVCCIKCHQHGLVKRFDEDAENSLHDHLFEFHAILCNQPAEYVLGTELLEAQTPEDEEEGESGQIQYTDEDVVEVEFVHQDIEGEEIIQAANDSTIKEASVVRHSGVWNYFEENLVEQKVHCLLCRQNNASHSYSTNSSTSNLRKHLKTAHDIDVENYRPLVKRGRGDEKRGYGFSRVWKYFCKVKKNGVIQDRDHVYCAECLKKGTQHRYKQTSSTGTLRQHLRSQHNLDLDSGREYSDGTSMMAIETVVGGGLETSPVKTHRKGKTKKLSSARSYYVDCDDDEQYVQCSLCLAEKRTHKYRKSTSSSTLKTHLVQKHEIDPDAEDSLITKPTEDGEIGEAIVEVYSFDEEVLERAQKLTSIKTRKIRTYFFRFDDEDVFCCAFCIMEGVKKAYKPTTSTSGLRRHLMTAHQMDPLGYFKNESTTDVTLNEEQLAESIAGKNKAKESDVWKYFSRKEIVNDDSTVTLDENYIYCSLCWNLPSRHVHKYKTTTSSGALKRHLASRHGLMIENRRNKTLKVETDETQDETEVEETEQEEHENQELFYEEVEVVAEQPLKSPVIERKIVQHIKLPKYCRSCGKTDAGFFTKLTAVFDDGGDSSEEQQQPDQISLSELYFLITGVRVKSDDGMSQLVCYLCEANLKSAYKFRKIALETENHMMQKLYADPNEMEDYEVLDEAYLEEDNQTEVRRLPQKKRSQKIFTVISNQRQRRTPSQVVLDVGQEEEQEVANYEVTEGQEIDFQDFDVIQGETGQVIVKRKKEADDDMNIDEMVWDDSEIKVQWTTTSGKKQKLADNSTIFHSYCHTVKGEQHAVVNDE